MYACLSLNDRAVCVVAVGRSGGCFSLSRFDIDLAGTRPLAYAVCSCLKFRLDHPICQCAWLLCVGVEDPSPSLALIETWRIRLLTFVVCRCSKFLSPRYRSGGYALWCTSCAAARNFGVTILSAELTSHSMNICRAHRGALNIHIYGYTARVPGIVSDDWLLL